jgi:hypothetical protein
MHFGESFHSSTIHREGFAESCGDDRPLIVVQLEGVGSLDRFPDHVVIVEVSSQVDIEDPPSVATGGIDELVDRMATWWRSLCQGTKADGMGMLGELAIRCGAFQVIPSDIGSEFIGGGASCIESYLDSTGRMVWIDGHVIGWHAALLEPSQRLGSEVVLTNSAFDNGVHTESCGMASKIRWRASEDAGIFEEIPKDFPEADNSALGG